MDRRSEFSDVQRRRGRSGRRDGFSAGEVSAAGGLARDRWIGNDRGCGEVFWEESLGKDVERRGTDRSVRRRGWGEIACVDLVDRVVSPPFFNGFLI